MGARLLTAEEVRDALGVKAAGKSDDELIEIARRIRVVTSVFCGLLPAHTGQQSDVPSVTR